MGIPRAATAAHAGAPAWGAPAFTKSHNRNAEVKTQPTTADEVLRLNTGWQQSPEQWRASCERRRVLKEQTDRIADALEEHGGIRVRNYLPIVALANVTGEIDTEESYRAICFLPLVAQRERRPLLNALRWFQKNTPHGAHLRLAVVTAGARIERFGPLRQTMTRLHRNVSRWAHEADQKWGVEVVYRGTEFTRDNSATYHPHANVLYRPRSRLSKAAWSRFLSWSRSRLGAHWKDCGELAEPDEAVKYPFKPADLDAADGDELVWLWWECHRMKFAQPMGAFADFRKELEAEGQKVVMVNRRGVARLEIVAKGQRDPVDEGESADLVKENLIVCRTAPQFRFGPFAQPVTLVMNYTTAPTTPDGRRRLEIIRYWNDQARQWWDANGAPDPVTARAVAAGQAAAQEGQAGKVAPIKVHTSRPTVQRAGRYTVRSDGTVYDPDTGEVVEVDRGEQNHGHGSAGSHPRRSGTGRNQPWQIRIR